MGRRGDAYTHRLDVEALYVRLDRERRRRRISWREIERQTGVLAQTFVNISRGAPIHGDTFATLMAWLGETDIVPYITVERAADRD